ACSIAATEKEVKYKVRWKGYAPDDDTWEPEEHLKDCKEVLLEFRKKMLDNKSKPVKKEIQKLPLNDDLFEADSEADSDWQSDTKGDRSPKKKKKKSKDKEDKSQDEMQKKKNKLGKVKEKPFLECENSSDSLASDSKPKKRTSESKEEIKDSKKQRREDVKDNSKKKESKDGKKKMKEESKENKHMQKGKHSINHLDGESSMQDDSFSHPADFESEDLDSDSSEEKHKTPGKYWLEEEKDTKKSEIKEKLQKKLDSEKEEKNRKEQRQLKSKAEIINYKIFFGEYQCNIVSSKKEESAHEPRSTDEFRLKDKQGYSRTSRDETDTWAYIAAEGDHDITEDSSDTRQQTMSLGMDMQLEWLSLEDFQKHLDGEDEEHSTKDVISSVQLRDAIKNGNYTMVKMALNSNEEYNLDQEDSSGMTLVMLAAAGGHDDILRLLIRKGAKVNCRQKNGTTALIHAAEKNNLTTAALLLEAGAHVNVQQKNGETALMKACKRGNYDIVRLMIENGADCNISSKHQSNALHFAKQCNNLSVSELLRNHLAMLTRVAEETIREYFEARLSLMEPIFDIACHLLCEGPDYSSEFTYKAPQNVPEGSGILLFIFHANFLANDVIARLCGPCSVQAVVLNDKFQLPVFLDSHFIYSFSPIQGLNKLFIRLAEAPTAKVKLLIAAYRVQLQ
uniref:M-phase phosphoprotein 8 n=1 Tax=Naja naja TaxID=35670 RepID=A0A8C6X480_NAJNA